MSHPNSLGNAVRFGDGKTDFLEALADWLEKWHDDCPAFTLTSKTSYALVLSGGRFLVSLREVTNSENNSLPLPCEGRH